jgi:predicted GIY-YIG superfamily endonuclease
VQKQVGAPARRIDRRDRRLGLRSTGRRLAAHRAGRASRYTASRLPVELVLAMAMADRTAARREEARIKALDRSAKLALIGAKSDSGASGEGHGGVPAPLRA